ncbi:MAG: FAD/NAD(P)-binding protein [Saprospiraceae bacterium]
MSDKRILGIVGIGPRGLYALEQLLTELEKRRSKRALVLYLFEATGKFGNGAVYDTNQVETNWINISERILCLAKRPIINWGKLIIPAFPSYHEWHEIKPQELSLTQADNYPPRAKLGLYLKERFDSLIQPLLTAEVVRLIDERVETIDLLEDGKLSLQTSLQTFDEIDEVLLTIGHQPTDISKQISTWESYFATNSENVLFKKPYPIQAILNSENLSPESTIGIRGFGLAMIDVVRAIANQFGTFSLVDESTHKCSYEAKQPLSKFFVPFSLDGLPPAPKPLNAKLDRWYQPTEAQLTQFESNIGNHKQQREASNPDFLIDAIVPIAAALYTKLPQRYNLSKLTTAEIERIVRSWFKEERYMHPLIFSIDQSAQKIMQAFVGMATGMEEVSLDFCIGQVWRHCQPSIYEKLSFNECADEVFVEIIELDERMKRYAYGPPVESIQQLLALIEQGALTLDLVENPEINLSPAGWKLQANEKEITVDLMINSVLDAPQIKSVNSPLIKKLLANELIQPLHDDYGVLTQESAYLVPEKEDQVVPIALLGRLAKGTIIGVDAILECFGERPKRWAAEAVNRHEGAGTV